MNPSTTPLQRWNLISWSAAPPTPPPHPPPTPFCRILKIICRRWDQTFTECAGICQTLRALYKVNSTHAFRGKLCSFYEKAKATFKNLLTVNKYLHILKICIHDRVRTSINKHYFKHKELYYYTRRRS
jgi:hypothetical protein